MAVEEDGLITPEKRVVIDTPNKTLDKLAGKEPATPEPAPEPTDGGEPKDEPSAIRAMPEDEGVDPTEGKDPVTSTDDDTEPKGEDPVDPPVVEEEDVDLNELGIDVDGQERTVAELLDERDQLAKRVAEIDGDEFIKGLLEHYKATGNIDAYYESKAVDWDKKSDLEVLRAEFDKKYADFDPKIKEKAWKKEISERYQIKDDLSPEELESDDYQIAQELLRRDARNARDAFKENQKKYQIPERKVEEPKQTQPTFDPAAYKKKLLQEKEVSSFAKSKLLPLGIKDGAGKTIGIEPKNPDQVIEMMVDDRKFWSAFVDPQTKKINYTKLAKAYAYAQDPDFYEQSLVNLGKNLHLEERIKEDKQIDDRLTRKDGAPPQKVSFAKGFLMEALKQKK